MHSPNWWEEKYKKDVLGVIPKEINLGPGCLKPVSQLSKEAPIIFNAKYKKVLK